MWSFWGIQIPPPETAVVPPTDEVRSTTVHPGARWSWAVMAAVSAAVAGAHHDDIKAGCRNGGVCGHGGLS